ncbi:hypothetical protein [Acinetobacter populi]|jgi:hypothetical protein|uniref:Uncharacterized protein n=1 Tax=Acinetobacter populi TaxID=1582270 RepID=A0A1Z9Z0U5_9GAMM|nr:hypothetical protein [Acinetobacter populi]MCH4247247.1 hypothetical protein [Acinetobacter populi]OUY08070.1 hypothetical protein CAP51_00140 [Acinetobacter populi]
MSVEVIDLETPKIKTLKGIYKNSFILIFILCFIVSVLSEGSFVGIFFLCFILLGIPILGVTAFYILFCIRFGIGFIKKNQKKCEEALTKLGFNIKYSGIGICIDTDQRKMAFIGSTNSKTVICDFSDVRSWHKDAFVETTQYRNHENAYAGSKSKTHFIHIVVRLADPEYPEVRFIAYSDRDASMWIARIDALING